jgi:hypothetical protein
MTTFTLITEEKTINYTSKIGVSKVSENVLYVIFNNGFKTTFSEVTSFLGNNKIDTWSNIQKIRNSKSIKNKEKYLINFSEKLNELNPLN